MKEHRTFRAVIRFADGVDDIDVQRVLEAVRLLRGVLTCCREDRMLDPSAEDLLRNEITGALSRLIGEIDRGDSL